MEWLPMGGGMRRVINLASIGAIGASLAFAASASAAGIVVDSTADPAGTASDCTLRQAIESANTDDPVSGSDCVEGDLDDTISFSPGILPATIDLTAGELVIGTNLTIQSPAAAQVTVDAGDASRVFRIPGGDVTISGMTITDGSIFFPGPGPMGGAGIAVQPGAALTLDDSAVVSNTGTANLNGGTIPLARVFGGGILNEGDLTVTDSTVSGNTLEADATNGDAITGAIADGAGISTQNGSLEVNRSTISGNSGDAAASSATGSVQADAQGAISIFAGAGASVTSSTIANNTMTVTTPGMPIETGGGVYANEDTSVTSSTVTGNNATSGANLNVDVDGSITLPNTIIAEPAGGGANCSGVTTAGHNFSSDASCNAGVDDFENGDAHLKALGNYGGPTQTRPPDEPAGGNNGVIDLGVAASQATDQRGFDRTWDFDIPDSTAGDGTDIGAVEIQGPVPLGTTPASPGDGANPLIFGSAENPSSVVLIADGTCAGPQVNTETDLTFASPGIDGGGPFAPNTATTFSTQTTYGDAGSVCSDPITYQRRPALPTLASTDPPSGGNVNSLMVKGTATTSSTVNIYTQAGCTGSIAATGTGTDLAGAGIPVTVPDNSTTTFYAQATGVGGTSNCSATSVTYSEVTPVPLTPTVTAPAATPAPTPKKCKKGQKLKKGKCVKKRKK